MRCGWLILLGFILLGALAASAANETSSAFADEVEGKVAYRAVIPEAAIAEVGNVEEISIALVPADGFHIDPNGPMRIDLSLAQDSAVRIKKRNLRRRDAVDAGSEAPRFVVPMIGDRTGQETLTVSFRFWLCRTRICRPVTGSAAMKVDVRAAQAPDGGSSDAGPAASDP